MEPLYKIHVTSESFATLKTLEKRISYKTASAQRQRLIDMVRTLSKEAVKAFQSKVPIDTGELRNTHITYDLSISGEQIDSEIYVDDAAHTGRRGNTMPASELARILDAGKDMGRVLRRTQDSHAVDPYTAIAAKEPTRYWIKSGIVAFNNVRRRIEKNG